MNREEEMISFKRMRFPKDVILLCVRWYCAYSLSLRNLEEMMEERGVFLDHSTVGNWVKKFLPLIGKVARHYKRPVGMSWRMDETYIKVNGQWKYLYRAVDKDGQTVEFLLTAKRDKAAAKRFFDKAIKTHGTPTTVTIDKSGSNKAALDSINQTQDTPIEIRQIKYLNNLIEQDHRFIKRIIKPRLGFKSFLSAKIILAGIELMHMIRKGQFNLNSSNTLSHAQQFYAFAGQLRPL